MDTPKTIIISSIPNYIGKINSGNSIGIPLGTTSNIGNNRSIVTKSTSVSCISTMETIVTPIFSGENMTTHGKKRRLDHLSMEEKMQRKKLKNRMAAQTSRDRKKAKMDELEAEVKELRDKNELLSHQCQSLQYEKQQLVEENEELRRKLSKTQTLSVSCNPLVAGPAVSNAIDPPLQGHGIQLALGLELQFLARILLVYLHFQICLANWKETTTYPTSKNLQKASFVKLLMIYLERFPEDVKKAVLLKWWGRHQKTWNPVDM